MSPGRTPRIAVVDDDADDRALVRRLLARDIPAAEVVEVTGEEDLARLLGDADHDLTVTEYRLGWTDGLEVLRRVKEAMPHHPVVMFTGGGSEEVAVRAMRMGLDDYVLKASPHRSRLPAAVRSSLATARHRAAEAKAAADLARLAHVGTHDSLTQLPNRTLLADRLEQALGRVRRGQGSLAVIFLDVDRFKVVNDSVGHGAGDELLRTIAERLPLVVRPEDTVARFGGDEFVILCDGWSDVREVIGIAERILAAVRLPARLGGRDFAVTASAGLVVAETGEEDPEELLRDADIAMYQAKGAGGGLEVFDAGMRDSLLAMLEVEMALRRGLAGRGLGVAYQPIVALGTGEVVGLEALARLADPVAGSVPPSDFVPVASDLGLMGALGRRIVREACRGVAGGAVPAGVCLFVNVSADELADEGFRDYVAGVLEETGMAPSRLCLEMTETSLMSDAGQNAGRLAALRDLGVRLAIDDFGTGYSSLAYLHTFPIDCVKIDRGFIAPLGAPRGDSTMVAAIVSLAHALGIQVVAEGVETPAQRDLLAAIGCDLAQGYLFARPAPLRDLGPTLGVGAWTGPA